MPGEHVSDEADKTAQERVKPVKEKAQEKFGVREKGKANSDIKEVKNDRMKTKETKGKDEKMKTEYSKEKHEEIKTNESKERRDKNKKTALNPQRNKPPFKNLIANGLVLASDGQKMSKSKKNYPDPMEVRDRSPFWAEGRNPLCVACLVCL